MAAADVRNKGYRFRIYLFAGFMVFLVLTSFAFTSVVAWYSKQVVALIVERDFESREVERSLFDLLLSMDRNRKKYSLLGKPEYKTRFERDAEKFQKELDSLKTFDLSPPEKEAWKRLRSVFQGYLKEDPLSPQGAPASSEGLSDLPLEEVQGLLRLNQDRMDLRIEKISRLEEKTFLWGLLWAGLSVLVAAGSSLLLIRSITKPINLLQKGTREIAEGRFSYRVDLNTRDELGDLAEAFNKMSTQLKELDDMKGEFMAMVSHELKTPLTSMKEAAELLREEAVGPLNRKQKNLLKINASGIQKLALFVDEILNITRMEGGLVPLYRTWFDFQDMLEEKLNTFRLLADKKQIRLKAAYTPDPFPSVFCDEERLKQVLANLLNNAIVFTPLGGEVFLQAEAVGSKLLPSHAREALRPDGPRQWLKVRVYNTGEGIPREEAKRVFDKFYQVKKNANRDSPGSGLGLTIAKYVVEAHGGVIWVEETRKPGATLVFVLPLDDALKDHRLGKGSPVEKMQAFAS